MSLVNVLRSVVRILDDAETPYMLTGSLAAAYHSIPRATRDLDVVIEADQRGIERIVGALAERDWYVDSGVAQEARRTRGQFNAIDPTSGWKVDFIVRKDRAFSRVEMDRRERVTLLGVEVSIASVEDVLIAKMEWSRLGNSALQRRDAVDLLERAGERLDRDYVEKWVDALGLREEWERAQSAVSEDGGG